MKVVCPVPTGSGAVILHRQLSDSIKGYDLRPYSPRWEFFPPMIRWLSRGGADLIHAPADYGIFSRRNNIPQILTLHGYKLDEAFRPFASPMQRLHYSTDLRWLLRRSLLKATALIAVSHFTARLAVQDLAISRDCRVIPNGVDTSRFTPRQAARRTGDIRVLFCGNLNRGKGILLLPGIADRLSPGIRILCAAGLRAGRNSPWRHPRIDYLGRVARVDMPALYRDADILLMPSYREGMSLALLEGMASGLPVVATDAASFPEVVRAGEGGYLCPAGNVEAFANAVNALAGDPQLSSRMGQYNRAVIETSHDERVMVAAYADLFEEVKDTFEC